MSESPEKQAIPILPTTSAPPVASLSWRKRVGPFILLVIVLSTAPFIIYLSLGYYWNRFYAITTTNERFPNHRAPFIPSNQTVFNEYIGDKNAPIVVAILVPTRTGQGVTQVSQAQFFTILMPSIIQNLEVKWTYSGAPISYEVYLAFDNDDSLYHNPFAIDNLREEFDRVTDGYPFRLHLFNSSEPRGNPVRLWNLLADAAYANGANYFYQLNDDARIETPGWASQFITALKSNPMYPDLGVTGPTDEEHGKLLTQSFVSRVHIDIFRHYYPPIFKNWWSDDWISQAYKPDNIFMFKDLKVRNTNSRGTRYVGDASAENVLKPMVDNARAAINQFLSLRFEINFKFLPPSKL